MPTCKLCGSKKKLCKSHIIPEFFFKPAYDEMHRGNILQLEPRKKLFIQKGYREKLFCEDCENIFSKYENYIAGEWYIKKILPRKIKKDLICIKNLNYKFFKLFHLSILFRASVSTQKEFEYIKLGPHENKIKELILNDNPGSKYMYTFFGLILTYNNQLMDNIIMQPLPSKIGTHSAYVFIFGGIQWNYIVSSHKTTNYLSRLYTGGDLVLLKDDITKNDFINDFVHEFNKAT